MPQAHAAGTRAPVIAAALAGEPARRRVLLGGSVAPAAAASGSGPGQAGGGGSGAHFAYTGRRTTRERDARGEGTDVHRVAAAGGWWEHVQLPGGPVRASSLALDAAGRTLYTVHGDGGEVGGFRVAPDTDRLSPLNRRSTRGKNPMRPAIAPTGRSMFVANEDNDTIVTHASDRETGEFGAAGEAVEAGGRVRVVFR